MKSDHHGVVWNSNRAGTQAASDGLDNVPAARRRQDGAGCKLSSYGVILMRHMLSALVCVAMVGCTTPQSERFVVKQERAEGPYYIYPPGPLPIGDAKVLVEDVINHSSKKTCTDIPLLPTNGNIAFGLDSPNSLLELRLKRPLVVLMSGSQRTEPRKEISNALTDFFEAEKAKLTCLKDNAMEIIRQAVMDSLPTELDQVLSIAFAFDPATKSTDVVAGQELCVEYADGRYRHLQDKETDFFGGGSIQCYAVDRMREARALADDTLVFNTFFAELGGINIPDSNGTTANLRAAASSVDLTDLDSFLERRRYRLFFPENLTAFSQLDTPSTPEQLPVLIGTTCPGSIEFISICKTNAGIENYTDLCEQPNLCKDDLDKCFETFTDNNPILAAKFLNCAKDGSNWRWNPRCFTFRERGIPYTRIGVRVYGQETKVTVGSTVWNLVEQTQLLPYDRMLDATADSGLVDIVISRELAGLRMSRRFRGRSYPVEFQTLGLESLRLPLLPGDEVSP